MMGSAQSLLLKLVLTPLLVASFSRWVKGRTSPLKPRLESSLRPCLRQRLRSDYDAVGFEQDGKHHAFTVAIVVALAVQALSLTTGRRFGFA